MSETRIRLSDPESRCKRLCRSRNNNPRMALLWTIRLVVFSSILLLFTACSTGGRHGPDETLSFPTRQEYAAPRLIHNTGSALLVVDMQRAWEPILNSRKTVLTLQKLVEKARAAGAIVIWVYQDSENSRPGTRRFEVVDGLYPTEEDLKIVKTAPSSFLGTELETELNARGIGRLVIGGLASNACVAATVWSAVAKDFQVIVPSDGHTVPSSAATQQHIDDKNAEWSANPKIQVMPAAAVSFDARPVAQRGLTAEDWYVSAKTTGFLNSYYQRYLARTPETIVDLGLSDWAERPAQLLNSYAPAWLEETRQLERELAAAIGDYSAEAEAAAEAEALNTAAPAGTGASGPADKSDESGSRLSAGDQLALAVCSESIEDTVNLQRFAEYDYLVNPTIFGISYQAFSFFDSSLPLANQADAENYVRHLAALPAKIQEATTAMLRRRERKLLAPRLILEQALPDLSQLAYARAQDTSYYRRLSAFVESLAEADLSWKAQTLSEATGIIGEAVLPAWRELAGEVQEHIRVAPADIGVWTLPKGDEYYLALLQAKTTTELAPQEIHQMGLDSLERIHEEIITLGKKHGLGNGSSPASVIGAAFSTANNLNAADSLAAYRRLLTSTAEIVKPYFPDYPQAEVAVQTAPQGGYYSPAPIIGTRPGVFYVAQGSGANKAGIPTLLYHETIPGHHLQIATSNELNLPIALKLNYFESYTEGWALYAERLMSELGAYADDPVGDAGRLQAEAFRAARLVVDTGIHSLHWTFDQAVDFMVKNAFMPLRAAQGEVIRYSCLPGQATSYYIGMQHFLNLRDKVRVALGNDFSLAAFHRTVLSCGPVPFRVLDAVVERYITEAKSSAAEATAAAQ